MVDMGVMMLLVIVFVAIIVFIAVFVAVVVVEVGLVVFEFRENFDGDTLTVSQGSTEGDFLIVQGALVTVVTRSWYHILE